MSVDILIIMLDFWSEIKSNLRNIVNPCLLVFFCSVYFILLDFWIMQHIWFFFFNNWTIEELFWWWKTCSLTVHSSFLLPLLASVMPRFTEQVESAVEALSAGSQPVDENEFIDASRLVYDGIRDIRKAVLMIRVSCTVFLLFLFFLLLLLSFSSFCQCKDLLTLSCLWLLFKI